MSSLIDRIGQLYLNDSMADVWFVFPTADNHKPTSSSEEEERLPAHSLVLRASFPVFEAMFNFNARLQQGQQQGQQISGSAAEEVEEEKPTEVKVEDSEPEVFKFFLRFLYTDAFPHTPSDEDVIALIYLARKYQVLSLETRCALHMAKGLSAQNVFQYFNIARFYELKELEEACWRKIDTDTNAVMSEPTFTDISHATLCELLARDSLSGIDDEYDLFAAMIKWAEAECARRGLPPNKENICQVLGWENIRRLIRFPLMSTELFAKHVASRGILTAEEELEVYRSALATTPTSRIFNTSPRGVELEILLMMDGNDSTDFGEKSPTPFTVRSGETIRRLKQRLQAQAATGAADSPLRRLQVSNRLGLMLLDNCTFGFYRIAEGELLRVWDITKRTPKDICKIIAGLPELKRQRMW